MTHTDEDTYRRLIMIWVNKVAVAIDKGSYDSLYAQKIGSRERIIEHLTNYKDKFVHNTHLKDIDIMIIKCCIKNLEESNNSDKGYNQGGFVEKKKQEVSGEVHGAVYYIDEIKRGESKK